MIVTSQKLQQLKTLIFIQAIFQKPKIDYIHYTHYICTLQVPINKPWAYIRTKDKFDWPIFGGLYTREEERGWGLLIGRKNTSICNLLNLLLSFLFSSVKLAFRNTSRRTRCELCSKLTTKTPE